MKNLDNPLFNILEKIADLFCIGLLWLVCSLPLITIGASTTALYHVAYKVLRNREGYLLQEFFSSFRSNFKQSTILWLIALFSIIILGADAYVVYQTTTIWGGYPWAPVIFLILGITAVMCCTYIFPYVARFKDSTKQTLKNVIMICLFNLPWSILLLLLLLLTISICLVAPLGLLCLPPLYMLIASYILEYIFHKYRNVNPKEDYVNT